MLVALQPAGSSASHKHYIDTIENPVPIAKCEPFLSSETLETLRALSENQSVPLWGVTPGRGDTNVQKYDKLKLGDYVLFSRRKEVFWGGRIEALFQSEDLARDLWGDDDKGQTWELMYALSTGREFAYPVDELREMLGYEAGWGIRGFQTLGPEKSAAVIEALGLLNPLAEKQTEEEDFEEALQPPPSDPDEEFFDDPEGHSKSTYRKAQPYIRDQLIPDETGTCDLCGVTYGKPFLRAAHVKPWRVLSLSEKKAFRDSAMIACVFGCDEIYERGYVTVVEGGQIEVSPNVSAGSGEASYIEENLLGRVCSAWDEESEPYFRWHRENRRL